MSIKSLLYSPLAGEVPVDLNINPSAKSNKKQEIKSTIQLKPRFNIQTTINSSPNNQSTILAKFISLSKPKIHVFGLQGDYRNLDFEFFKPISGSKTDEK